MKPNLKRCLIVLFSKSWFLVVFFFSISLTVFSQDILKGKDLSQIKVDAINAADLAKLKAQINSSGMTLDQAEQMAISKGLPASEAAKLKQRLNSNTSVLKTTNESTNIIRENANPESIDNSKDLKGNSLINPLIFGSELYTSAALSFEPNLKLATPTNYVLGPDDQITISVYGVQEYNGNLQISPEGSISIPNVGEVKLAGLTIEAATQKLKSIMGKGVYSYLKSGEAKLSVTLSKIKSINLTIIGSNRPGNYKVSSFTSVFNALYAAGGPSTNGSFREIELLRNDKIVKKIDLYRFLIDGNQSDNIGLKDNDVIRIPVYKTRIEIQGQVKRPGIFEVLPGESISKIIEYASGFTDTAYKSSIKVFQRGEKEREVHDVSINKFNEFIPKSGDVYIISKTLNKFQNRVTISGAVYRPDVYEYTNNLKVLELVNKADGLKQDAFVERAQILRLKEDLTREIISFNIKKALEGDLKENVPLQKDDEVIITSVFDLKDQFKVSIQGEIRLPGVYDFVKKLTLKDLILQAGGFTDAAMKNIEIARLIKRDSLSSLDNQSSQLIKTTVSNFNSVENNLVLEPFDVITIRRLAGYQIPQSISISGQVQYPGQYSLNNINDRVSDIIKRAGGFSPQAFIEGAFIKRYKNEFEKERANESAQKLKLLSKDSLETVTNDIIRVSDKIPLDLEYILQNPGSSSDILIKANDELVIPKFDEQVRISGEVLISTQIPYNKAGGFKDYINYAGGFTSNALKSKSYIVYANGRAASTKSFLFFKFYPNVKPGSEIIIPKKGNKKVTSIAEIAGFATIILSLVSTYVLLQK